MKAKAKTLLIVNGYGMGNSTRTHALIERLGLKDVSVATSGNGLRYFRNLEDLKLRIHPLLQAKYFGGISLLFFPLSVLGFLFCGIVNSFCLISILLTERPQRIIVDSNYNLIARLWPRAQVAALNNSRDVLEYSKKKTLPIRLRAHLLIEKLEYFYNYILSDVILVPQLKRKILTQSELEESLSIKGIHSVGLLVRSSFLNPDLVSAKPACKDLIMPVMSKGEAARSFDLSKDMLMAKCVVSQGGYSSLAECMALNVAVKIKPIKNHSEQYVNAMLLKQEMKSMVDVI